MGRTSELDRRAADTRAPAGRRRRVRPRQCQQRIHIPPRVWMEIQSQKGGDGCKLTTGRSKRNRTGRESGKGEMRDRVPGMKSRQKQSIVITRPLYFRPVVPESRGGVAEDTCTPVETTDRRACPQVGSEFGALAIRQHGVHPEYFHKGKRIFLIFVKRPAEAGESGSKGAALFPKRWTTQLSPIIE